MASISSLPEKRVKVLNKGKQGKEKGASLLALLPFFNLVGNIYHRSTTGPEKPYLSIGSILSFQRVGFLSRPESAANLPPKVK